VKSRKGHYDSLRDYGEVFSVPYGGMFFHRDLVATRGSFDESYYIYLDDTEFCMRHRKAGGVILCALASKIDDLEISCYNTNRTIINFATKKIYFQMYYYIRNRVFFEKKYLVSSWPVYITNMILYSSVVTLIAVTRFKFKNLAVYYTALFHGLTGRMGFNEKYRI
jgi:GT2 family glycosyltransferase